MAVSLTFTWNTTSVNAQTYQEGLVETRILDFDPQAGMKSQHFYFVDFSKQEVTSFFETGTTKIDLGVIEFDVSSIRDNFRVSSVSFNDSVASFTLEGTTASGVAVMPDIDYRLDYTITESGKVSIQGCHDAYPAYLVQHQGQNVYSHSHESMDLIKLFGTCDKAVNISE